MILGVGIDLIEIERFEATLQRTPSIRGRLFTPAEQDHCADRTDRLAARFAAKEAVAKAMGTGIRGFRFIDIEVVNDGLGRPSTLLHRGAAEVAASSGILTVHLSLTSSLTVVGAYAVAEGDPGARGVTG